MADTLREGDWVRHRTHGVGRVSLSSDEEVLVEFSGGRDEVFEVSARKQPPLTLLTPRGFWLRKQNDREAFSALVGEQPIEALNALVADEMTEVTEKDLKSAATPDLVPAESWDDWFSKLMDQVKSDPRFEVDKNGAIAFRGDLGEMQDELVAKFRQAPSLKEKQRIVKQMLQLEQKGVPVDEARETAVTFFAGTAMNRTNKMGARLEALIFLEALDSSQHEALRGSLLEELAALDIEQAAVAVSEVADNMVRGRLFELIWQVRPETLIEVAFMLTKRFKKMQRDWTLDTLLESKDKGPIKYIIDTTMADIATNLQPFVWLVKSLIEKPAAIAGVAPEPDALVASFFKMLNNMHFTSAYSARSHEGLSITREEDEIVKLLKDEKKVVKFLDGQQQSVVSLFAGEYFDCLALDREERQKFVAKLREKYSGLEISEVVQENDNEASRKLTREAYNQFVKELEQIVKVKLPEALREIQTAREWGDVSDNAELRVAQEKQRMLQSRKIELERALERCTIID